jgi:hypothetical protein
VLDFGTIPFFHLAKLNATYYRDAGSCELCEQGLPAQKIVE